MNKEEQVKSDYEHLDNIIGNGILELAKQLIAIREEQGTLPADGHIQLCSMSAFIRKSIRFTDNIIVDIHTNVAKDGRRKEKRRQTDKTE